ncbi:MAG TPA: NADH-quinone oxidoreductase subunit J [Anaerolineales bacterium]|nr:NADH-quinone oxidoreductase subunit J [Anaerolineales bacterium]
MTVQLILFFILAIVAVLTAVGMLVSKNAVYAALYLILNFAAVAVFYLLLNAPFLAVAQVTVYAGAIMVLFLFVIMLLGAEKLGQSQVQAWQRPLAIGLGLILAAEMVYILVSGAGGLVVASQGTTINPDFGSPANVGMELFTKYLLPFEVTSVLLLVAIVGAIVMTRVEKK